MAITQDDLLAIETSLGQDVLFLTGFNGYEGISRLFSFELSLVSENHAISFDAIVGTNVTVTMALADGNQRYFHGVIASFSQGRSGGEQGSDTRFSSYRATMVPWLWLLSKTADSRIFQNLSIPEIVEKVFQKREFQDFSIRLQGSYEKRIYCVQYRETDFNFVSRLLEEEGIFYFFEHNKGKHTLVIADNSGEHKPCPRQESAPYHVIDRDEYEDDAITSLEMTKQITAGAYTLNDFNFKTPTTDLKVVVPGKDTLGPGKREIYDYPGLYENKTQGSNLADIRMEEVEVQVTRISGSSSCRAFTSGYRFKLKGHFRSDLNNKEYVLVSVAHQASDGHGVDTGAAYSNHFECIPYTIPYRPLRITPKPVVQGSQTAIVVGPQGEEIYTDEHGRIKVQFHWDREGKTDDKSSCWIRVSQVAAGAGWGAIDIPRIGHEVIVSFLEGDPDRPIITGRVYHGMNKPPTGLPKAGMVSGMKSNSTPGGGGYNEMTMDDTKGKEKITIHGQYDMNTTVEHDQTNTVNNKFTETIKNDATIKITEGKYSHDVIAGTATYHVQGAMVENYDASQATTVKDNITIKSSAGAIVITSDSMHIYVHAATSIQLHTGASKLWMASDGNISLEGVNVTIKGSSSVTVKGGIVHSEADSEHQTKGAIVISEGSATNTVKGGMVMLNP